MSIVNKEKREKTGGAWLVFAFFLFFLFLLVVSSLFKSNDNSKGPDAPEKIGEVEFCNNTKILFEDKFGDVIKGDKWYTQDGQRWEKGIPNKIQKGIFYTLWVDSPTHYVDPQPFEADCINENDTKINYVRFDSVFKRDKDLLVRFYDENSFEFTDKLTFYPDREEYFAKGVLNIYPVHSSKFMPFGGIIIFEYPREVRVFCDGNGNGNEFQPNVLEGEINSPGTYAVQKMYNAIDSFEINRGLELDSSSKKIYCVFNFFNPDNKEKVDGENFTITLIPSDYYITRNKELHLEVTKEYDEIFEYVSNQSIKIKGTFEVK